jgi:phosphate transport system substrate-binding protein
MALLLLSSVAVIADDCFEMRYAGATTLQRYFMPEMSRMFFDDTEIRILIEGGNTDPGIKALLRGEVDMAGAGRHLNETEKSQGLVEHLLGWDVLTVVLNRDNVVEDISLQQLQGIFSGEIVNWRECGGPDLPIVVIACPKGSGMRRAVQELILEDRPFLTRAVVSAIVAQTDRHVAMYSGAIAVLSASMVDDARVKVVKVEGVEPDSHSLAAGEYSLAKPLALVTRGKPRDELEVFINLATSSVGKKVLAKHFVPLELSD